MAPKDEIDAEDVQFTPYGIKQIAQDAGVDRMSKNAALRIAFEQQREVQSLAKAAHIIAQSSGRKTVKEEDILAVKEVVDEVDNV